MTAWDSAKSLAGNELQPDVTTGVIRNGIQTPKAFSSRSLNPIFAMLCDSRPVRPQTKSARRSGCCRADEQAVFEDSTSRERRQFEHRISSDPMSPFDGADCLLPARESRDWPDRWKRIAHPHVRTRRRASRTDN